MEQEKFIQAINRSYNSEAPSIYLGTGILDKIIHASAKVNLQLRIMTRHSQITGFMTWSKTSPTWVPAGIHHSVNSGNAPGAAFIGDGAAVFRRIRR